MHCLGLLGPVRETSRIKIYHGIYRHGASKLVLRNTFVMRKPPMSSLLTENRGLECDAE